MNKILNINLGGYALTIDDDAYEYLSAYLDNIRKRFSESEGRDEIVHDIEMRLGELISQGMGNRTIVMMPDIEAAVQIMGKPEDFGGESSDSRRSSGGSRASGSGGAAIRTGKRLFRDEDDTVAGGVCSGLSAYFGIEDPVWMRLSFVLLTFLSAGFWIPGYILMWILVPPAKTAAERLAMRGEPVNVDNIAREIEEGFERLSTKVNEFGTNAGKKASSGQQAVKTGVVAIGQIFALFVRFFAKFGILILILVGICVFVSLIIAWVAGIFGMMQASPYIDYLSPYPSSFTWLGFTNLFFLLGIPALSLCLVLARVLFKIKTPFWLRTVMGVVWFLNLACVIILAGLLFKEYRQDATISKQIDLSGMHSDTLRIESVEPVMEGYGHVHFFGFGFRVYENRLETDGSVEIMVRPNDNRQFECSQTVNARGDNGAEAEESAIAADFQINPPQGNVLRIPTRYNLVKGAKWRFQEVKVDINVPVGKFIVFGKKINEFARSSDYADMHHGPYLRENPDCVFLMTNKGLVCTNCPKVGDANYKGDRDYEKFILEGDFDTEFRKGDDFSVKIEGSNEDKKLVQIIESDNDITLTTNGKATNGRIKVIIVTPRFTNLHADNTGEVLIRSFNVGEVSISARGNSRIKAQYLEADRLTLALSGKCTVDLTGKGDHLEASLTNGAMLDGSNWHVDNANISASEASRARVFVENEAVVKSDADSKIQIDGTGKIRTSKEE